MGDRTGIEWADATWSPLIGCSRVSRGCEHCYAERLVHRGLSPQHRGLAKIVNGTPHWTGEVRLVQSALDLPLRWRKPRRIFVASMADLFHKKVPDEWILRIYQVMGAAHQHTYQILTKRPERMAGVLARITPALRTEGRGDPATWTHLQHGVSVENQATADARIPLLLQTPAVVRWVSLEPCLGPVDLSPYLGGNKLNWVVIGGESGPGHRPMEIAWVESVVNQCRAAGVPIFVKQDSGPRAGQQGRIHDELWIKEVPA